jgi:predicted nucleic acid-binding protein
MSDRSFLDTNIFLYSHDRDDHEKQEIAQNLILMEYGRDGCCISTQVLAEFFQNYAVKFGLETTDALKELHLMCRCPVIEQSISLIVRAVRIFTENGLSFWDSMIVAAALEGGAEILYSEDMQHGLVIDTVRIMNPFVKSN